MPFPNSPLTPPAPNLPTMGATRSSVQLPYRRIVVSFLVAVAAIVALVLYYTLAHATITLQIEPSQEVVETTLRVGDKGNELEGTILETSITESKEFPASPSGEHEDKASGKVTLTNNSGGPQTLIATTRLQSPDNILFRLKETVTVEAGQKLEGVSVVADKAGEGSAIGPARFTIPGLRPNLRDKIFAESSEPMRRAEKPGSKVTELDLEQAKKAVTDTLVPQALAKLREQLPAGKKELSVVYQSEVTPADSNVAAGTVATSFKYTATAKVTAVFYDPAKLREQALKKPEGELAVGRKILTLEEKSLAVTLDGVAPDLSAATLQIKFMAQVSITDPEKAFSRTDLIGRTKEEVQQYFTSIPGVKSAEVELSPFWVTSVPTVVDNITLQLKP